MNNEDGFKQRLAEKLRAANDLQADEVLWLKIAERITPRQKRLTWPWYGLAASLSAFVLVVYLSSNTLPITESSPLTSQLLLLDVELQHALLMDPESDEIPVLLEKRNRLKTTPARSYQL